MSLKYEVSITLDVHNVKRIEYNRHGDYHRNGGAALMYIDCNLFWFQYGVSHRDDGPSDIWKGGRLSYCYRGKLYSESTYNKIFIEGKKMKLYEIYADAFVDYLDSAPDYCYTWEISDQFELDVNTVLEILSELKKNGLVEHEDIKGGRWWTTQCH